MSWKTLAAQQPELATFGVARLHGQVSYLATIRADGSPRLHPMTPIIGAGRLFVFMEPTSPKGLDLQRDGRYAIHCAVSDNSGKSGEFGITGRAQLTSGAETRQVAMAHATYPVADRYVLYEFEIASASATTYPDGKAMRRNWKAAV